MQVGKGFVRHLVVLRLGVFGVPLPWVDDDGWLCWSGSRTDADLEPSPSAARAARIRDLHRPHRPLGQSAPRHPAPEPITSRANIIDLNVRRRDRHGGILHEYEHAA
jgi:hypothetical protein